MSTFTSDQRQAIEAAGNVLVVAGAGTGKTRTLVERCVEWLLHDRSRNSLDQVLMVTFTEAAAAEMRQRIREALRRELDREPEDPYLLEQTALLETAFISTLHSFCYRLVRQHFYELHLDPQLNILPAEEAQLLAEETLTKVLDQHYTGAAPRDQAVQELIQVQARGWDVPIKRLVLRLYQYTQTLPDPGGWFAEQARSFSVPDPVRWREWLSGAMAEWTQTWLTALPAVSAENPNVVMCVAALRDLPSAPSLEQFREALERVDLAYRTPWPRGSVATVRDRIEDFFEEARFFLALTSPSTVSALSEESPSDPLAQDWAWVRQQMSTLLELTQEFGVEFAQAKRELGALDFHDLEQFSLRLLWDPAREGPTPLAEEWRKKLSFVAVDEYQDINAAQDAILRALGRDGPAANRFLVGDPKQSIYRFRLAAPRIFQKYVEQWGRRSTSGRVISLTDNFRSHEAILDFVNRFFSFVMQTEVGGIQYDERARLRFGASEGRQVLTRQGEQDWLPQARVHRPSGGISRSVGSAADSDGLELGPVIPHVELHLRVSGKREPTEPAGDEATDSDDGLLAMLSNAEKEARLVGLRLAELRGRQHLVWDEAAGTYRPVAWRDMVILLRAPQLKAESYAKEFSRLGIPLMATRGGFFESSEISDLLSLLNLLDNPLQDVPLLAVLRSPFVALSFDELAIVRLASKGAYWNALQQFHRALRDGAEAFHAAFEDAQPAEQDPQHKLRIALRTPSLRPLADEAWRKVDLFLRRYGEWRRLARQTSLSRCLDQILDQTQYTAFLLGQAQGQQQCGNVSKLLSWARRFDQFQRQSLFRFLKFVDAQKQAAIDREPAPLDVGDAVRLMSIHQSKGLEFAVVVLADLGKTFNLADLKGEIILDEQFGLCPLVKPPFTEQRYPSLPYWLAQRRQRRESLGEEVRLLYVAMTRACQSLILAGTTTRAATERWAYRGCAPPAPRELLSAKSYLDWIGPWLGEAAGRTDWASDAVGHSGAFSWRIYEDNDLQTQAAPGAASQALVAPALSESTDPATLRAVQERLAWQYPFQAATEQPAKASVSSLRLGIITEIEDGAMRARRRPAPLSASSKKPELSAAEIGVAHHLFLQMLPLHQPDRLDLLEAQAEQMQQAGMLSAAERTALDLKAIASFWRSQIGRQLLEQRDSLQRELPFTFRFPLSEAQAFRQRHLIALEHVLRSEPQATQWAGTNRRRRASAAAQDEARRKSTASGDSSSAVMEDREFLVVTGVVDLVALLPKEIWLLDFKTDAVSAKDWKQKAALYAPQMQLYSMALSRIYQRPVTRCWLHSLALSRTLVCELE